jgi:hypothetical protein
MAIKTEVHQQGTAMELKLSRKLVRAMEDSGVVLTPDVSPHLQKLKEFYKKQIKAGLL